MKKMLSDESVSVLCLELAETIKSGITISEGFLLLSEQAGDSELSAAYKKIYEATDGGGNVSSAMHASGVFPDYAIKMLYVAERTGASEMVLRALSDHYKRQAELKRTIRSAVLYPMLLLVIILAVFFVFIAEVLPVFDRVFSQIGAQMLPAAEFFMNVGIKCAEIKWVLLAIFAAIAVFAVCACAVAPLREKMSEFILKMFSNGKTGKKVTTARLASVISLSVSGTRDIGEALELSKEFAEGTPGSGMLEECSDAVASGGSFSKVAEKTGLFSPVYCRMIAIGEHTGSTDSMMREIAGRTQNEMEASIQRLTGSVEPVAVIILSVCVGLLLLSVMLPLVGIMSAL